MMNRLKKQRGASLLELMISMALGLILLLALSYLMIGANRTSTLRVSSELADETARQVFAQLERNLMLAGFVDPFAHTNRADTAFNTTNGLVLARYARLETGLNAARDNQHHFSLLGTLSDGALMPLRGCGQAFNQNGQCPDDSVTAQQGLMTSFEAIRPSSNTGISGLSNTQQEANINSGIAAVCQSVGGQANEQYSIIRNLFWLAQVNREEHRSLFCHSERFQLKPDGSNAADKVEKFVDNNNTFGAPIQSNVEQLTFRYLTTSANDSQDKELKLDHTVAAARNVNHYLQPHQVSDVALNPLGWSGVVGVEICIIVAVENYDRSRDRSIMDVQPTVPNCLRENNSNSAYANFVPNSPRPANDSRIYRRYMRVLSVPNNVNLPLIDA